MQKNWIGKSTGSEVDFIYDHLTEDRQLVTEAVFTYVAIDSEGNTRPITKEGNPKLQGLI